jgi:hypothetical protein
MHIRLEITKHSTSSLRQCYDSWMASSVSHDMVTACFHGSRFTYCARAQHSMILHVSSFTRMALGATYSLHQSRLSGDSLARLGGVLGCLQGNNTNINAPAGAVTRPMYVEQKQPAKSENLKRFQLRVCVVCVCFVESTFGNGPKKKQMQGTLNF